MTPEDFIRANTALAVPPLVPEIRLHLGGPVTPLWEATEATLAENGLPPPYWAFAWPGGQALTRYLLDRPELVAGKRVLDFASGSGLSAVAAAKMGAERVVAADLDRFAAAAIALNAAVNGVAVEVEIADLIGRDLSEFDVILAGDIFYEKPLASRAEPWLRGAAQAGAPVLFGDPGRAYLPPSGLEPLAEYVVPTSLDLEDRTERLTKVWRLLPQR